MYRQEQAEAEKMCQKEVGKSAEVVERLKEAEREQVGSVLSPPCHTTAPRNASMRV
jgi:hypothetical protein